MKNLLITITKFLSLVLRHQPETIGLSLDEAGWADVNDLIERSNRHGQVLTPALLDEIVATNEKKCFAFNAEKRRKLCQLALLAS